MISFLLLILLGAVVVNLTALFSVPDWRPFQHSDNAFENALALAATNAAVLIGSCIAMWPLHTFVMLPLRLTYLQLPLTMIVIAIVTLSVEQIVARRTSLIPASNAFRLLMIANGAAAGIVLIDLGRARTFVEYLVLALTAVGVFGMASVAMALMQQRLRLADVPASFRGTPLTLISVGIAALALMGLVGLVRE
jgi:H+/Na+-translocating ferredoxin:NAD+ oxidoreductase subunit A